MQFENRCSRPGPPCLRGVARARPSCLLSCVSTRPSPGSRALAVGSVSLSRPRLPSQLQDDCSKAHDGTALVLHHPGTFHLQRAAQPGVPVCPAGLCPPLLPLSRCPGPILGESVPLASPALCVPFLVPWTLPEDPARRPSCAFPPTRVLRARPSFVSFKAPRTISEPRRHSGNLCWLKGHRSDFPG